jgi:hypothetical protein
MAVNAEAVVGEAAAPAGNLSSSQNVTLHLDVVFNRLCKPMHPG